MSKITPTGAKSTFYYLHNQQFSVYALLNSTGAIAERYQYSSYGHPTIEAPNGTIRTVSAQENTYMYTGRNQDAETGLQYFRNRYYSDSNGRFISRDPIGYVDGFNLYRGYFVVNGKDSYGYNYTKTEIAFKNEDNTETEKNENWASYTGKDTKDCYYRINLKVKYTEVKVPITKTITVTNGGVGRRVAEGLVTPIAVAAVVPEPFVSKGFATAATVVGIVAVVVATIEPEPTTLGVSIVDDYLIGFKSFNVVSHDKSITDETWSWYDIDFNIDASGNIDFSSIKSGFPDSIPGPLDQTNMAIDPDNWKWSRPVKYKY
jgi:RHS repeat-associated protein